MIIGMGCSEIPAWLDIDVTVDGACGSLLVISHGWVRRRCNGNASHPSKRRSPKRFFISPKRIPLRYVTQMEGHGRNIFIPFRRSARYDSLLPATVFSCALRKFIFYRIESTASRARFVRKPLSPRSPQDHSAIVRWNYRLVGCEMLRFLLNDRFVTEISVTAKRNAGGFIELCALTDIDECYCRLSPSEYAEESREKWDEL